MLGLCKVYSVWQVVLGFGVCIDDADTIISSIKYVRIRESLSLHTGGHLQMLRTPILKRQEVPEKYLDAFDYETKDSGGLVTSGPGSAMINSPEMRKRANQLVYYLRDESSLPKQVQELAMILTARAMDCQYIWYAHSVGARDQGISQEFIDALREKKSLPKLDDKLQVVVEYVSEVFATHRTSQKTFDRAIDQFGAIGVTELTTLIGYYTLLAFNANSFDIDVPNDNDPKLPI